MFAFIFTVATAVEQTANNVQPTSTGSSMLNAMGAVGQFLPFILIIAVFYLFIIRPQSQQRKALAKMISNLNVGDKIITKGGIIGTINQIKETTLIVELHDGTKVEMLKHAVISMLNGDK